MDPAWLSQRKGRKSDVRYEMMYAMLLNEFLKEHRKVEKLEATVAKQEATIHGSKSSFNRPSRSNEKT